MPFIIKIVITKDNILVELDMMITVVINTIQDTNRSKNDADVNAK